MSFVPVSSEERRGEERRKESESKLGFDLSHPAQSGYRAAGDTPPSHRLSEKGRDATIFFRGVMFFLISTEGRITVNRLFFYPPYYAQMIYALVLY